MGPVRSAAALRPVLPKATVTSECSHVTSVALNTCTAPSWQCPAMLRPVAASIYALRTTTTGRVA